MDEVFQAGARVLLPSVDLPCQRDVHWCETHDSLMEHQDTQTCRAARQARGTANSFLKAVEPKIVSSTRDLIVSEMTMRCHALGHPGNCAVCGPLIAIAQGGNN